MKRGNMFAVVMVTILWFSLSVQAGELQPLSSILDPDGTVNFAGTSPGSFDPRGYTMSYGSNGEPVFTRADRLQDECDFRWSDQYAGIDFVEVYGLACYGNYLYAIVYGYELCSPIMLVRWDGVSWSILLSWQIGVENYYALAIDESGNVYLGGDFYIEGDPGIFFLAKWDGTSWSTLGSGVDGYVYALLIDDSGNLYAGGWFWSAGGVEVNNIAKWDGTSWSALGSGVDGAVNALLMDSTGNLYAGGEFWYAGGIEANYIAQWDGSSWSALGSGMDNGYGVYALAVDEIGNLYAGGYFSTAGGVEANNIAQWDGISWSALGSGMDGEVRALAVDEIGNLYAGGLFWSAGGVWVNYIAEWDGSSWSALGSGMESTVLALAVDETGSLYAGGIFTVAGEIMADGLAIWDGASWSALYPNQKNFDDIVECFIRDGNGNLYAGGAFTTAGGVTANHIAQWDGNSWSALGSGMNYAVTALAVDGNGNLYAGGHFTTAGDVTANRIARWDGNSWSALGSGMNSYVSALAVDDSGNLYAGGRFTTAGDVTANRIARWDGNTWLALGSGIGLYSSDYVNALAVDDSGNLYAGGHFTTAGGVTANRIARWDGSSWSALGSGLNDTADALAVDESGNLYAGGSFTKAGGVTVNRIARWDGSSWSALGSGMDEYVFTLFFDESGNLYAGGAFTTAGSVNASGIARWDGSSWSTFGYGLDYSIDDSYVDPWVNALAVDETGTLYAGGDFCYAGGNRSPYFASYYFGNIYRDMLTALYDATNGPTWIDHTNWLNASGSECTWYGVSCDNCDYDLTELNLANNNLDGPLPSEIGDMDYLIIVDFAGNHLIGEIPGALGELTNLAQLDLNSNILGGELPVELLSLTNLIDGQSDFRWNALSTADATIRTFLNTKQIGGDWESTQTVPATDLTGSSISDTEVRLEWTPIPFTSETGGYELYYRTDAGSYSFYDITADKSVDSMIVSGLTSRMCYDFALATVTDPHLNNNNLVRSNLTSPMSILTIPVSQILTVTKEGNDVKIDWSALPSEYFTVLDSTTLESGSLFTPLNENIGPPYYHNNAVNDGLNHFYVVEPY
ncbi:hypothetical protein JXQ70_14240 [bacterium]|nr:hypothetical protein [bacterium]